MAVNDEQFMKVKHVKGAVNKLRQEMAELDVDVPQATTTAYGTVKLISDEDWEAYTSDPIGADSDSLDLSPGSDFTYSSFSFEASCSNGTVSISGSGSFSNKTIIANTYYELFSLPEGYAPSSEQTHSVTMNGYSATATVDTNGVVTIRSSSRQFDIYRISFSTTWTFNVVTSEVPTFADNVVLTVEQFKNLLSGGSSGGGSGESGGDTEQVLYSGMFTPTSSSRYLTISENIVDFSAISVTLSQKFGGPDKTETFSSPFADNDHSAPDEILFLNSITPASFMIVFYTDTYNYYSITEVVGIK